MAKWRLSEGAEFDSDLIGLYGRMKVIHMHSPQAMSSRKRGTVETGGALVSCDHMREGEAKLIGEHGGEGQEGILSKQKKFFASLLDRRLSIML